MAFPHTLKGTIGLAIAFSFILATFTSVQYTSPVTDTNKKVDTAMRQMVNSSNPISGVISTGNFILVFSGAIFDYVNIFYTVILGRVGGLP